MKSGCQSEREQLIILPHDCASGWLNLPAGHDPTQMNPPNIGHSLGGF